MAATLGDVNEPAILSAAHGGSGEGKQVPILLDIARDQVDEAYRISELLESKARNLLQAASVFFAASQAAVGIQIAAQSEISIPTWMLLVAVAIAGLGLFGVAMTAYRAVRLQEPQNQQTISIDGLCNRLLPFAERDDPRVPQFILNELGRIVSDRRDKNESKADALKTVQFWAFLALGSSTTALFFGLVTAYSLR
jgi:hypothetical protein